MRLNRLRLGGLLSEGVGRNLAASAGLAFFLSSIFFIGSKIYDASEKQDLRAASSSELEVQTDQVIDQKCKAKPENCIAVSGITTVSHKTELTQQANQDRTTAEVLDISWKGTLACATGLGIAATARRRRENQLETEDTRQFSNGLHSKRVASARQRWDATVPAPQAQPTLAEKIVADHGKLNLEIFDFAHGTDFAGINEEVAGLRKELFDMSVDFGAPDPAAYKKIVQEEADAKMWATIEDTSPERARLWLELREEQAAVKRERADINLYFEVDNILHPAKVSSEISSIDSQAPPLQSVEPSFLEQPTIPIRILVPA